MRQSADQLLDHVLRQQRGLVLVPAVHVHGLRGVYFRQRELLQSDHFVWNLQRLEDVVQPHVACAEFHLPRVNAHGRQTERAGNLFGTTQTSP